MVATDRHELVTALARNMVEAAAPQELAFFGPVAAAFARDPDRVLVGRHRPDQVLGADLDTVVTLISPVALAVASSTYRHLLDRTGDALVRRGRSGLGSLMRRLSRGRGRTGEPDDADGGTSPAAVTFDEGQLAEVKEAATVQARALGLDDEQVDLLVAALMANLDRQERE